MSNELTTLILSNNQIKSLPDWVGELMELRELYLDNNLLERLPTGFASLQLRRVSLGCNPLTPALQQLYDRCPRLGAGAGRDPTTLLQALPAAPELLELQQNLDTGGQHVHRVPQDQAIEAVAWEGEEGCSDQ